MTVVPDGLRLSALQLTIYDCWETGPVLDWGRKV
jgi:hypothetical protein